MRQKEAEFSFHEATVVDVFRHGSAIHLSLDDALLDGAHVPVRVAVEDVRDILRQGVPAADLRMEEEDGEVLSLRQEGDRVLLVVQWNDFSAKRQKVVTYSLLGGRIASCGLLR